MLYSRSRPKRSENGQAMIEYQVLIPGSILLAIAAAWLLGPNIGNVATVDGSEGLCPVVRYPRQFNLQQEWGL